MSLVFAIPFGNSVRAGDGSVTETIVWKQQGAPIVVSYSRDRDGVGRLLFKNAASRKIMPVAYHVESDKDFAKNLTVASMQSFNDLFVLTLETSSGYLIQIFMHDEQQGAVVEVATTSGWWQPEFMYFGDQGFPAIGVPRQPPSSKAPERALVCGEKIFVFNPEARRIEEVNSSWADRGRKEGIGRFDPPCS